MPRKPSEVSMRMPAAGPKITAVDRQQELKADDGGLHPMGRRACFRMHLNPARQMGCARKRREAASSSQGMTSLK